MPKTILITILSVFSVAINAQIIDFPDPYFKLALTSSNCVDLDGDFVGDIDADTNDDNEIDVQEAQAVLTLLIRGRWIQSLEGIENFTNLEILNCNANRISTLDFSENLALEEVYCFFNDITDINISQNLALRILDCDFNELTTLDTSNNINLEQLWVTYNDFSSIDVSQNPSLKNLNVSFNNISALDVSSNLFLERLRISSSPISEIDLSQNTNLITLDAFNTQISNLDLSSNSSLFYLNCSNNAILEELNFQTGTNASVAFFNAAGNPSLNCIQVDDATASYLEELWFKDENTSFSENCLLAKNNFNKLQYQLYPNPVKDNLYIEDYDTIKKVEIFTLDGKKIVALNNDFSAISLTNLPKGMYILSIESDYGITSEKLIKE